MTKYVPRGSSFISTQFVVVLSINFMIFWYYYIKYQIINTFLSFFWRYIYFVVIFLKLQYFFSYFFTNEISCLCCFLNDSFWRSFKWICCRLFNLIKKCFAVSTSHVFTYFCASIFTRIFRKRQKLTTFSKYLISRLNWIVHYLLFFTL